MHRKETLEGILSRIMRIAALLAHKEGMETACSPESHKATHWKANGEQAKADNLPSNIVQPPQNDVR